MTTAAGATPPSAGTTPPAANAGKVIPKIQTGAQAGPKASVTKPGAPTTSNAGHRMITDPSKGPEVIVPPGESTRGTPPNDDCSNAIAVAIPSSTLGDNFGAAGEQPQFGFCGTDPTGGVWYSFVGDGNSVVVTTCSPNTPMDTKLVVYTGTCASPVCVIGDDDDGVCQAPGFSPPTWRSTVQFSTTNGQTYYVLVCGYGGGQGSFELDISDFSAPQCADCPKGAVQEGEGQPCGIPSDFFNGGCNSVPEVYSYLNCGDTVCGNGAFDGSFRDTDWYWVHVDGPTNFTWATLGSDFDWQLLIINMNSGCAGLSIPAFATGAACSTGSCSAIVGAGDYVMWMGPQFSSTVPCESFYVNQLTCEKAVLPENDDCSNAQALEIPAFINGSTSGALPEANAPFCGTSVDAGGIWYTVTGTGDTITVSLCGSSYDTKLHVYCGTDCDNLFCAAGIDDFCGLQSQVDFCSTAGQTYWILVEGFAGSQGSFTMSVTDDGFACGSPARCSPIVIECQKSDVIEGEFEATGGCGTPVDFFNGGCNSVPEVYSYNLACGDTVCGTAAFDGSFRDTDWYWVHTDTATQFDWCMIESAFDWQILIIDMNAGCAGLSIPGFNVGTAGTSGCATAIVGPGDYVMWMGSQFTAPFDCPGGYRASLTCSKAVLPKNDDCANAQAIGVPSSTLGSNQGALADPQATNCGGLGFGPGVWYTISGTGNTVTATTCSPNTFMDTQMIVYCGSGCDSLFCVTSNDDDGVCSEPGFSPPEWRSTVTFCTAPGTTYWIFVQGFGGSQGDFELIVSDDGFPCSDVPACEPCTLKCSGNPEGEDDCGVPVDTTNGGCNSVPPVFTNINCGDTFCGTGAFDGGFRDTDWYQFTNDTGSDITLTWTVAAEFDFLAGYIEWQPGFEGSGDCANITGFVNPFLFSAADCNGQSVTVTVGQGVHWFFVAPQFSAIINCGPGNRNNYSATLSSDGCPGGADCNQNGIDDAQDIKAGTSSDCFDYGAAPIDGVFVAGGANGIPDECECIADWDRNGVANSTDVSELINTYFYDQVHGTIYADVDCNGVSNSTDVSNFINVWFSAQAGQLPFAGCSL